MISGSNPIYEESELVFGLVGPVGTNFELLLHPLRRCLQKYEYRMNEVRISDLIQNFAVEPTAREDSSEYARIERSMHAGNSLRFDSGKGDFLALAVAKAIHEQRPVEDAEPDKAVKRTVHVVRSLKHPDEVRALRRIYGNGFFLIGVIAGEEDRRTYLRDDRGCDDGQIEHLVARDEHEENPDFVRDGHNYGQRMRDTFHLADVFLPLNKQEELSRFVSLVFGHPYTTPKQDEHAMFMAFAAALRSADLSRQVGAVVVSAGGDLISMGANDVPIATGGLYWPGDDDKRDYTTGEDKNEAHRTEIVDDVLRRLAPVGQDVDEWIASGTKKLVGSRLMDITEFGRAVHAEMEALLSCARSGNSPRGGALFSTTFPCHNCAKHIVDAGIARVVYVEPYPKSQALKLFPDSIRLGDQPDDPTLGPLKKVVFEPFTGIGPRRFLDLFSTSLSSGTKLRRKANGKTLDWKESKANVRVPLLPNSYIDRERAATRELMDVTEAPGSEP